MKPHRVKGACKEAFMGCRACEKPKVNYKKGLWSPDEDQRLRDYVLNHGLSCWSAIPAKAGNDYLASSCSPSIDYWLFICSLPVSGRFATQWEELQAEVDQLSKARPEAWQFCYGRGGNDHETSSPVGKQVSILWMHCAN